MTLKTKIEGFQEGSQTKREVTTVTGATKVDVSAIVVARDGRVLLDQHLTGRVRFFGENLGATHDLAKRIAKLLNEKWKKFIETCSKECRNQKILKETSLPQHRVVS